MKFMASSAISYSIWHAQLAIWELKTEKTKQNKRNKNLKKKKLLRLTKSYIKIWTKKKKQIKELVKRKEK